MLVAPRPSSRPATLPAPTGGIDTLTNLASMDTRFAILTKNIDATTRGLKVRPGYSEWVTGFASGGPITTIMPFTGAAEDGSNDALFASNTTGIYDITASTSSPSVAESWGTTTPTAGRCSFTQFTIDSGDHMLLVADDANGLRHYAESTGLWTTPALTGPTVGSIAYVMQFKERVWYIEKDGTTSWYTAPGAVAGTLTEFDFGVVFKRGGNLRALFNWTLDSGEGPDDYLVAVSGGGDVVVYQGTDPSDATKWGLVGQWYIGDMPFGRRIGSLYGGDLLLLSSKGLVSMTALLRGVDPFSIEASASWRVQGFIEDLMAEYRTDFGWEIKVHPSINKLVVSTPKVSGQKYTQLVYDVNMKAWSTWESMPMGTSESFAGEVYIAGENESVWRVTGNVDNATLTASDPNPIDWEMLSAFSDLGAPVTQKRMQFLRPVFIANQVPAYEIQARFDYDLSGVSVPGASPDSAVGIWDAGTWDSSIWGGLVSTFAPPRGATGIGSVVAIGLRGRSTLETTLNSIDLVWDQGGLL